MHTNGLSFLLIFFENKSFESKAGKLSRDIYIKERVHSMKKFAGFMVMALAAVSLTVGAALAADEPAQPTEET